jgi:hypothetical protein
MRFVEVPGLGRVLVRYLPACPAASQYHSQWVFDPQGGVAPQVLSFNREAHDPVRLGWLGAAGRLYGVRSTQNPVSGPWSRFTFSAGANTVLTVLATNQVVEVIGADAPADTPRCFRVVEAD